MADPFRSPDPPREEKSEADEMIRRAQAKRGKKWPFFVVVLGIFALPFLYIGYARYASYRREHADDLDSRGVEEAKRAADEAERSIAKTEAIYTSTMTREKLARIEPGTEACKVVVPSGFALVRPGRPVGEPEKVREARQSVAIVRGAIASGQARSHHLVMLRSIASGEVFSRAKESVLVAEQIVDAAVTQSPDTKQRGFVPGRIVGTVYVYSYADDAVVCAGRVEASSSQTVEVTYVAQGYDPLLNAPARIEAEHSKLAVDLRAQTEKAIAQSVRSIAR